MKGEFIECLRLLRFRRLERRDDEVLVNLVQINVLFQFLRHTYPY